MSVCLRSWAHSRRVRRDKVVELVQQVEDQLVEVPNQNPAGSWRAPLQNTQTRSFSCGDVRGVGGSTREEASYEEEGTFDQCCFSHCDSFVRFGPHQPPRFQEFLQPAPHSPLTLVVTQPVAHIIDSFSNLFGGFP